MLEVLGQCREFIAELKEITFQWHGARTPTPTSQQGVLILLAVDTYRTPQLYAGLINGLLEGTRS